MRNRSAFVATVLSLGALFQAGCDNKGEEVGRVSNAYRETKKEGPDAASTHSDASFLTTAAQANLAEVNAGRVASRKSDNEDVWRFAQHMITDHSDAQTTLLELARKKRVTLPVEAADVQQKSLNRLSTLSGPAFDRAYMDQMVTDHLEAVALFEKNAKDATDPDVRSFAAKLLPKLRDHLKMATELKAKVVVEPTSP